MPNIGPLELVVILIIALIVLGPKRLPEVGRSVGRGMREFRGALSGERRDDDEDEEEPEDRDQIHPSDLDDESDPDVEPADESDAERGEVGELNPRRPKA